jgi:G6PDH family F420-dependent oxidoreductase
VSHHGKHYEVQEARIYTRPEQPVPIYVSAFGPQAVRLAARIGDGYSISMPDGELVKQFREAGGGDKPVQGGTKVCWDADADAALKTAHRLWGNEGLPGQTSQILPRPKDFAALMPLVPPDTVAQSVACGPDPDRHIAQLRRYIDADIDEVYVQQIGPDMDGFFAAWEQAVLPAVRN